MRVIKHNFSWSENESQEIFWKYQGNLIEQSKTEVQKIVKLCNINTKNTNILDVGCGMGYHVNEFGTLGFTATGIEVSDYSYQKARKNCQNVNCSIYKILAKEITWEEEFGLVIAIRHTLGYMTIEELYEHLRKIKCSLKNGGTFLLSIPYTLERGSKLLPIHKWSESENKYTLVDKYIDSQNYKIEKCIIIDTENDLIEEFHEKQRYYSWQEITEILSCIGFRNIRILKNFDGEVATDGIEARIYMCQK